MEQPETCARGKGWGDEAGWVLSQRTDSRGKMDSLNWVCKVLRSPLGTKSLPTAAQPHPRPTQSLTTFVIPGKLRSGIPMSMIKALGFEAASWSLTKVSGVKHPAPGRAQSRGELWARRWGLCSHPGPSGHSWGTLGQVLSSLRVLVSQV